MKPELTQARLKELLHYDPETGHFTWIKSNSNCVPAGARAGAINSRGYCQIKIDRRGYMAHRLAFLYMTGSFPPAETDHINRERLDNRWANLRPATPRENEGNKGLRRDNTSGHRGVTWDKQAGKWKAQVAREGRMISLGRFADLEEAAAAARKWRDEYFGVYVDA